jgi:pSer/pThr/pTyr-binding forkhead associated (FHA) protein
LEVRPDAVVGRDDGSAVAMDEDTVSARHAAFRFERGRWLIEDLGSTNGTYVNRRRVTGKQPLSLGDEVQFGRVCVRFGVAGRVAERRTS